MSEIDDYEADPAQSLKRLQSVAAHGPEWATYCDAVFDLQIAQAIVETSIFFIVSRLLGWDPEDITFDYYDRSFELFGAPEDFVPSAEQLATMWALGLDKFWTHVNRTEKRQPGEKRYASPELIARYAAAKTRHAALDSSDPEPSK